MGHYRQVFRDSQKHIGDTGFLLYTGRPGLPMGDLEMTQSQQDAVEPIATVWVTRGGYGMELSTHVAYVLPDGNHLLYATPPRNEAAMRAAPGAQP